jgi:hypothetical protein
MDEQENKRLIRAHDGPHVVAPNTVRFVHHSLTGVAALSADIFYDHMAKLSLSVHTHSIDISSTYTEGLYLVP